MTYYSPIPQPRQDCGTRLIRALQNKVGDDAAVDCHGAEAWASGLFLGTRYAFSVGLTGDGCDERAQALARTLPETEFEISGHIVADLAIESHSVAGDDGYLLYLSILTIAEC
ncbi:MAG: hypothetical protein ACSLE1_09465 [Sphingobium sp.]